GQRQTAAWPTPEFRSIGRQLGLISSSSNPPRGEPAMSHESRRSFNAKMLGSLMAYGLIDTLFSHNLFAESVKPVLQKWMLDLHELTRDVKEHKIKDIDFQTKLEELYKRVDLQELVSLLDLDRVA